MKQQLSRKQFDTECNIQESKIRNFENKIDFATQYNREIIKSINTILHDTLDKYNKKSNTNEE